MKWFKLKKQSRVKQLKERLFSENYGLNQVKTVGISENDLMRVPRGLFPDWFQTVEILNLSLNKLKRIDRKAFKDLNSLKCLHLDHNKLEFLVEGLFENCYNLQKLFLQNNQFKLSPMESLKCLTSLKELDLSFNQLRIFNNYKMNSLEILKLQQNQISFFRRNKFMNLINLDLSKNKLYSIDVESLRNSSKLINVNFSSNRIDKIHPETFQDHINLKTLLLNDNLITDFDCIIFHQSCRLIVLQLANNVLVKLNYNGLKELRSLHLQNNSRLAWTRNWQELNNLQHLYLNGSVIKQCQLPKLKQLNKLLTLDLSDCVFHEIPYQYFVPLVRLQTLRLNGSRSFNLSYMNVIFFSEPNNLKRLFLHNCLIRSIDENCFLNLQYLTCLDLSDNLIANLHVKIFRSMIRLQSLNLNRNSLSSLDRDIFLNLRELTYIDLSFNNIKSLSVFIFSYNLILSTKILDSYVRFC